VARTLADLTLKLTRELSAHEARCAKEVEQAEKSRDAALMKVGSLQSSLKRYHQGLSKAKDDQWKSVQKANEIRDKESHATAEARRQALLLQERKHARDRAEALQVREDALRLARTKREAALRAARERPLSQHYALRKAADRAFEEAVQNRPPTVPSRKRFRTPGSPTRRPSRGLDWRFSRRSKKCWRMKGSPSRRLPERRTV